MPSWSVPGCAWSLRLLAQPVAPNSRRLTHEREANPRARLASAELLLRVREDHLGASVANPGCDFVVANPGPHRPRRTFRCKSSDLTCGRLRTKCFSTFRALIRRRRALGDAATNGYHATEHNPRGVRSEFFPGARSRSRFTRIALPRSVARGVVAWF